MFEKEANKWVENNLHSTEEDYIKAFKDGVEFGYNKANEWHYPSKGEYPKECENVLCYCRCKGTEIKFCCVGHTVTGGDNKIRWWSNNKIEELRVIAWKEITPPKEVKEE